MNIVVAIQNAKSLEDVDKLVLRAGFSGPYEPIRIAVGGWTALCIKGICTPDAVFMRLQKIGFRSRKTHYRYWHLIKRLMGDLEIYAKFLDQDKYPRMSIRYLLSKYRLK